MVEGHTTQDHGDGGEALQLTTAWPQYMRNVMIMVRKMEASYARFTRAIHFPCIEGRRP